jgi:hypothetical protein
VISPFVVEGYLDWDNGVAYEKIFAPGEITKTICQRCPRGMSNILRREEKGRINFLFFFINAYRKE